MGLVRGDARQVQEGVHLPVGNEGDALPRGGRPRGEGGLPIPQAPEGKAGVHHGDGPQQRPVPGAEGAVHRAAVHQRFGLGRRAGAHPPPEVHPEAHPQQRANGRQLPQGEKPGQGGVGVVAAVELPELPQHIGHVGIAGGGQGGVGAQQAPVLRREVGQQCKQQRREQIALVHLHGKGVHHRHQQRRAVEHHLFPPGAKHRRPAAEGGYHRAHKVQQLPGKARRQRLPVPADKAPEVVGVDGIIVVIVQGGLVALQQPQEVKPLGKGQGQQQHRPHRQGYAQQKLQPPPLLDGEEQI